HESWTVAHVHEIEHDERRLRDRNRERDDRIELPRKIYKRSGDRQPGAKQQRPKDRQINSDRNYVFAHDKLSTVLEMPPKQVQQREQKYPHDVDEVPVKSDHLHRTV